MFFFLLVFNRLNIYVVGFKHRLRNSQKLDILVYVYLVAVKHFLGIVNITSSFVDNAV